MKNYRFRLSDMMPNAWFYKLRDMSKLKNHPIKKTPPSTSTLINPRKSFYYYTDSTRIDNNNLCNSPTNPKFLHTHFPYDPPRKSSPNKKSKRKTIYMPSPTKITPSEIFQPSSDDQDFLESQSEFDPDDFFDHDQTRSHCSCCELTTSASDIIIDVEETSPSSYSFTEYKLISELEELPPVITKSKKLESPKLTKQGKLKKNRGSTPGGRKSVSRSGGVKIKRNGRRKSVKREKKKGLFCAESFAVVKASFDPEKDFRDSMMEMIMENNIVESKDLEELLACYLSLNENQYHGQIIKAFEQIWFNIPHSNLIN